MATASGIQAQLRQANIDQADEITRLNSLNTKIGEVETAIKEIKEIKDAVNDHNASLKSLDYDDPQYWKGSEQRRAQDYMNNSIVAASSFPVGSFFGNGYQNTNGYWYNLDDLATDLDDTLVNLKKQRDQSQTAISRLKNTIIWLQGEQARLTN
jgi:chaperonin cofactor prefoldin